MHVASITSVLSAFFKFVTPITLFYILGHFDLGDFGRGDFGRGDFDLTLV